MFNVQYGPWKYSYKQSKNIYFIMHTCAKGHVLVKRENALKICQGILGPMWVCCELVWCEQSLSLICERHRPQRAATGFDTWQRSLCQIHWPVSLSPFSPHLLKPRLWCTSVFLTKCDAFISKSYCPSTLIKSIWNITKQIFIILPCAHSINHWGCCDTWEVN